MDRFFDVEKIGQGFFCVVYKAFDEVTKQNVVLKKLKLTNETEGLPSRYIREISLLKELKHTNIIRLLDVVEENECYCLVFEYMEHMDTLELAKHPLLIKKYLHQLIEGIAYCHSQRVIHRDLKLQNLLIDPLTSTLKIADFGNAKALDIPVGSFTDRIADFGNAGAFGIPVGLFTNRVFTCWYGAPEVLLGSRNYSLPIDIWAIGCIFAEMVNQQPLFPGDSEIDTLYMIFRVVGSPNEVCWPGVTSLPDFEPTFPKWPPKNLAEVPNLEAEAAGQDLLSGSHFA